MSRKQEIYREILLWALPMARNAFSGFCCPGIVWVSPRWKRELRAHYEIAEFVHNIPGALLKEEFTMHDIYFLNFQARIFFERNSEENCLGYSLFVYYIQQLFQAVPDEKRVELKWEGPPGDWSWAGPKTGREIEEEEKRANENR